METIATARAAAARVSPAMDYCATRRAYVRTLGTADTRGAHHAFSYAAAMAARKGGASTHPVRSLTDADERLVVRLRKLCMSFPEANERISHGEPTWFAGKGKVFAMLDNHHHASPHLSVWLPQPSGVQETLLEADSTLFFRPPYVGVKGWVGVILDAKPVWPAVEDLVRDAYVHVATKKLRAALAQQSAT